MTTVYKGRDSAIQVAGNVTVNIMPAVAQFEKPAITVAEWDAGTVVECNIRKINVKADAKTRTEQYLCDEEEREERGPVKWSLDDLEINAGNPQKPDAWLASLEVGDKVFIGQRYGLPYATPGAADQLVNQLTEAEVTAVQYVAPEANSDGAKFFKSLSFAVQGNKLDVKMTA